MGGTPDWTELLHRIDDKVQNTSNNVLIILENSPRLRGMLKYNEFRSEYIICYPPPPSTKDGKEMPGPYPRVWEETDVTLILGYIQRTYISRATKATVEDAMVACAKGPDNRFHPVMDYLDKLEWDGEPRLDKWLCYGFGCKDSEYYHAIGSKILIAAVRRIKSPGIKFDHILILEGSQGIGKSSALRALFGDEWFTDAIPRDLTSKDLSISLSGVWCVEFAEIEHINRTDPETLKAFLSRQTERYRPPYGKSFIDRPRMCIMFGTTNSDDYLRDESGNRRIWPACCVVIDIPWIEKNRNQLWAEAVSREKDEESIWLDDSIRETAVIMQAERVPGDPWKEIVEKYILEMKPSHIKMADILEMAVCMSKDRIDRKAQTRMGKVLRSIKWKAKKGDVNGQQEWAWFKESGG